MRARGLLVGSNIDLLDDKLYGEQSRANDYELRVFLSRFGMARLVDASDCIGDAIMRAGDLCGHQVDVVVAGDGQQHIRVANARLALHINIDPVSLDQLDAFELRSAAEPCCFFVNNRNLVASLQKLSDRSRPNPSISDNYDFHLYLSSLDSDE